MYRRIPLTQGRYALVDAADFPAVSTYSWFFHHGYAERQVGQPNGRQKTLSMHRFLLPTALRVDHRNGNGLDNRRANLREATQQQNCWNRAKHSNNKSGYKGVSWDKGWKRWRAQLTVDGKTRLLGASKSKRVAARLYRQAAQRIFGDFKRV